MSDQPKRKLIEVALPLEAINVASAREKSIRHGHPSTLHLWWSRKPLATCRAVLFASLVDDPSSDAEHFPTKKAQEDERTRLFGIIERLVQWENTTNEAVLEEARAEIRRSTGGNPPLVLDPFCGGGSIPLEAQRLGLAAYASDLNPVAVLITKALIEIPPEFVNRPPVHPDARRGVGGTGTWKGAAGLAEDVRRYGAWMSDEAERRISHLYPMVRLPKEHGGGEATVVAWLWARTVTCPNPACGAQMPLVRSFELSKKPGKEAWAVPLVNRATKTISFTIGGPHGVVPEPARTGRGANFRCLVCEQAASDDHMKTESRAGRMGAQLVAIVAEGTRGRIYLPPEAEQVRVANSANPSWGPEEELATHPQYMGAPRYGLTRFCDLFTPRQLVALTTYSDLVHEGRSRVLRDALGADFHSERTALHGGDSGAQAYADAVATYLGLAVGRMADLNNALCQWRPDAAKQHVGHMFARQAIPMAWDYAEANPIGPSGGGWDKTFEFIPKVVAGLGGGQPGIVTQADAAAGSTVVGRVIVSTDPPYYDNVPYADLSDFFYVWLRRTLVTVQPDLFATVLSPKSAELIADVARFGGREAARDHFERGLGQAFEKVHEEVDSEYPVTVYYAFRQTESDDRYASDGGLASTGWETMLEGLLRSGFAIHGTWPMRSELGNRMRSLGSNALASSIVLVCRPRQSEAGVTTRKDFVAALKRELPEALRTLQHGNIAPVDLAQASIGPGMAIFSRYPKVLEPDGSVMRVRAALALINTALDEILTEQEGEFDADTRWAIAWYEQFGLKDAAFGTSETLSKAKNTSIEGLVDAGILAAARGRVRLLAREEYSADWDPATDERVPVWEAMQRLIRALLIDGEAAAAALLAQTGGIGEVARDLAYRLYHVAERKRWTEEARAYNTLVVAWPDLVRGVERARSRESAQASLGFES